MKLRVDVIGVLVFWPLAIWLACTGRISWWLFILFFLSRCELKLEWTL